MKNFIAGVLGGIVGGAVLYGTVYIFGSLIKKAS